MVESAVPDIDLRIKDIKPSSVIAVRKHAAARNGPKKRARRRSVGRIETMRVLLDYGQAGGVAVSRHS